jgi:hypothetical protein
MILKKIEFDCLNKNVKYAYNVKTKAKFITNYVNRNCLEKLKYKSDISILAIHLTEKVIEPYYVNNGFVVSVLFEKDNYDKINTIENYFEYYYKCIKQAFEIIQNGHKIPKEEIIKTLVELKENNYRNNWMHKNKIIKGFNIKLNCELNIYEFTLILNITKNNEEIFNKIILKTDPDEVAFEYRFKDIVIKNDIIIITEKNGNTLYEYKM